MARTRKSRRKARSANPGGAPSAVPGGEQEIRRLIAEQNREAPADENLASEDEDEFDDEDLCFTTGTLDGDDLDDISEGSDALPGQEDDDAPSDDDVEEEGSRAESASER